MSTQTTLDKPVNAKPTLEINYTVPNYEVIKDELNWKEYHDNHPIMSYDQVKKLDDKDTMISTNQPTKEDTWTRPSTLIEKPMVQTTAPNGEEVQSEVQYQVHISKTYYENDESDEPKIDTCYWVDEFYYAMVPCVSRSKICKGLVQGKIFTDKNTNESKYETVSCSACRGTMFENEKITYVQSKTKSKKTGDYVTKILPREINPSMPSTKLDWYQNCKPITILSCGFGKDSVCMVLKYGHLVDEIIFSDTGAEEIETYEYIKYFFAKMPRRIRDKITIIQNDREGKIDEWHYEQALQPMPFANRQCTDKWKIRVIHRYIRKTYGEDAVFDMFVGINYDEQIAREQPLPTDGQLENWFTEQIRKTPEDIAKLAKRQNISVADYRERIRNSMQTGAYIIHDCTKCGKECNSSVHKKCPENKDSQGKAMDAPAISTHVAKGGCQYARNIYPLIEDGIGKNAELEIFKERDIIVPPKSGCYFCPMKGKKEWKKLEENHPNLYENVKKIEEHSKASLKIMNMSVEKKDTMRCSCSNGLYDEEVDDNADLKYVAKKITGRGI